mgnify:CR=1 FL=1
MAARRQVTGKLSEAYRKVTKVDKSLILDKVIDTTVGWAARRPGP